ncbi:hypothetical protein CCACVL1_23401, partial [Corchorus capsularis]
VLFAVTIDKILPHVKLIAGIHKAAVDS